MDRQYYLGIDQGTTGTTVLLVDDRFQVVARGYREHKQYYPQPGWVEHDPEEIWSAILSASRQVLCAAEVQPHLIRCIGLDNQGETCLIWDRTTGQPVAPAIVWQDRRTAAEADILSNSHGDWIRRRTGVRPDAYFSATKLQWLLKHVPGLRQRAEHREILAGTLDSWLLWKLTGGRVHATDPSTASRTMLFSLRSCKWDPELLALLDIPSNILPEVRDSAGYFGQTDPNSFLGICAPVTASLTDQQAALFGQRCFQAGEVKATYGTGCFLLMNTGSTAVDTDSGLLSTIAWRMNGHPTYALNGGIYIAGAAVQWLRDGLQLIDSSNETEALALEAGGNGGMFFVPAFSGLAAPHWDQYARGTIIGLTAGVTKAQFVRATLESVAYQVCDNLSLMQQVSGIQIPTIRVDGGMAANRFLMQFQADILGIPVEAPPMADATALGAIQCAALGLGDYTAPEELPIASPEKICYEPAMRADQREALLYQWHRAVDRALSWIEHK